MAVGFSDAQGRLATTTKFTHATSPGASIPLPELSDDGTHLVFISTSDLAPAAPGNADGSPELFVWSECGAIIQLTSGNQAVGSLPTDPSLAPTINTSGTVVAFVSGSIDSPYPLETTDGKGYLFRAVEDPASACVAVGTPTPTAWPPWLPTPTPSPGELGPEVCPQILDRVPAAEIARAVSAPEHVSGWLAPANPTLPIGPFNPPRHWLSIRDLGKPFGPANPLIWKAGCP
jgi:hypothetical protein